MHANPYPWAGSVMMGNFKQLQASVMRQILPQIPLDQELMPELSPGYASQATLDATATLVPMLARMEANAPADAGEAVAYWNTMTMLVHGVKDQLPETDAEIAAAFTASFDAQGLGLNYDQVRSAFIGGAGDDVLVGTTDFTGSDAFTISRDNVLYGGAGDDLLMGGSGADIYMFGYGSGNDEIREVVSGNNWVHGDKLSLNTVRFLPGVTSDDVAFEANQGPTGTDLVIRLISTGETLIIKNQFNSSQPIIQNFAFADGTSTNILDVVQGLTAPVEGGVSYALPGFDSILNGTSGDDYLAGDTGGDILQGAGGKGNDTLDGGTGYDILKGGKGNESYVFAAGSGRDKILESGIATTDAVRFGSGITADQLQLSRGRDINDLVIRICRYG